MHAIELRRRAKLRGRAHFREEFSLGEKARTVEIARGVRPARRRGGREPDERGIDRERDQTEPDKPARRGGGGGGGIRI